MSAAKRMRMADAMKRDSMPEGRVDAQRTSWRKRVRWDWVSLAFSAAAFAALSLLFPQKGERAVRVSWEYFQEMVFVLPAVMVLMGLFAVWVRRETVAKYLGEGSGLSGLLLAVFLGTLPTGPLYVAFPLAAMLLKKGARMANVTVFLTSWACIKLPMELMEAQFLGWRFALLRLGLTVALVVPMGLAAEALYRRGRGDDARSLPEAASAPVAREEAGE